MPPTVEDRLRDILEAIAEIDDLLAGTDFVQFAADKMRRMATERYLEIVCEAARHLSDDVKQDAPEIEWQRMVDFGNRLRHAYHATDVAVVWSITRDHLPPLKAFVERRIRASNG
ncbi:HepT-like ribonuclease domain-containing protein [Bradyrhizobium oligotrophicum]|uniref:HepT-like ribonuclease domain-containing protein n=1 Tax=Bradyrhizobium oligotrophicum TaxID=44255 RepID=UPI003EBF0D50